MIQDMPHETTPDQFIIEAKDCIRDFVIKQLPYIQNRHILARCSLLEMRNAIIILKANGYIKTEGEIGLT